ncbi:MAG: CRISPR-associated protein Cas4 [Candidatus Omnitrophica bacterium]|nr:CRISPR-associated protein Cas4 [Candidatus Omnitrophota bacterium]
MYLDDDFLQLSALQHFVFCRRQCALIHIEQVWQENLFTAEGRVMHDNAHEEQFENKAGARIERGMPLRSEELGLNGKADVIEFHKNEQGQWIPFPVEYKRGKPKSDNCDKVQLCAQALCLEEMLNVEIPEGAIFYGKTRRRMNVVFDEQLRAVTKDTAVRLHEFIKEGKTPKPAYAKKCESCSLIDVCMPKTCGKKTSVANYLKDIIESSEGGQLVKGEN